MIYQAHYDRLITRARTRDLKVYSEKHHVLPRCLGGTNEAGNIVRLTPEEHYVAHQLLVKINPGHHGLIWAAIQMTFHTTNNRVGNRIYGWLRRLFSNAATGRKHSRETRAKMSSSSQRIKRPHTTETRRKIAAANHNPSIETRAKISAARRSQVFSTEAREKMTDALRTYRCHKPMLGKVHTPETRAKIGASKLGKTGKALSLEHRAKISARLRGNKHTLGKKASPETRAKMSIAARSRHRKPHTAETRAKISATKRSKHYPSSDLV